MLYKIFMAYDKRRQTYALGEPVQFSVGDVRQVRLTGTRKKALIFTFHLELDGRQQEIDMDVTPFCFRKMLFIPLTSCRMQLVTRP